VSLSADGLTVAIGAPINDNSKGQTRVYHFDSINLVWVQMGQDIDGEAAGDQSGYSVSLSADGLTVAIGATNNDGSKGQTRVYQLVNNMWVQLGQDIDGEAANDASGYSVSLSADGSRVAIGARDANEQAGQTRVYYFNGGIWEKMGQDIDGEAAGDQSGWSVSLSADGLTVAIGAPYNVALTGQTRVLHFNGSIWEQMGQDIDGEAVYDRSGWSVSLSADGSRVAIGARDANEQAGQTRAFNYPLVAPTNIIATGMQLTNFLTTTDVAGYIQNNLTVTTGIIVNTTDVPKTLVNDTPSNVSIIID